MKCPRCKSDENVVATPRGASNPLRCRACMVDFGEEATDAETTSAAPGQPGPVPPDGDEEAGYT